ncbi:uncharacterized protein LOC123205014 [Mangifera indica]|uniref:uncharacterized protein LOC123205014 n=1 Tax=Mangifera indica TaxID=29780 RepID=UPI001CF9C347|nr:uncharacterized protein LOC123205014 [Mangifera indica]
MGLVLLFWFQVFCSRIDCRSSASFVPCIVLSFQNQPLQLLTCCACYGITAAVGFFCRIQTQIFCTSLPQIFCPTLLLSLVDCSSSTFLLPGFHCNRILPSF